MLRGHAVEEYNIVEYFVHTYEEDMETRYKDQDNEVVDGMTDEHRGPGRKRNERILYLPNHMARSFASSVLVVTTNFLTSSVVSFLVLMILIFANFTVLVCCYSSNRGGVFAPI